MKKFIPWIFIALFLALGCGRPDSAATAGEATEEDALWRTDLKAAVADARDNQKLILLNFSGSDWCRWCRRLDAEVFSKSDFQEYADKNLVAILADFPRRSKQDKTLKAQNERLMKFFKVEGFPTLLLFNSDAELIGQLGYQPGGPQAFIQAIQRVVARSQMRASDTPPRPKLPVE